MTQANTRFNSLEEYIEYDNRTDFHYELVDGALIEMPPERPINRKIASFLFAAFLRLGLSPNLIAIGTQIAITSRKVTAREPDFVVLSEECAIALDNAKSDIILSEMPAPALVVEVVSPGNPGSQNYDRDYVEKPREYAARGILEFWQIDPSRAVVNVLSLENGIYQSHSFRGRERVVSPAFPDLQLTAEQILQAG
ncbi:hypothetical protein LEP3755_42890 [Leptolyngbya sp. NIES-3755]|nr:hypothetical protein LEP3755_42890 [Leptolyngbya sp. NIES-3755]